MSIKNLDNLDEAITSISAGLTPRIIVTTNGTAVYATKSGVRVDGIKVGNDFVLSNLSNGTWTVNVSTTAHSGTGTGRVTVSAAKTYTASIILTPPKPTNLTDTYWRWGDNFTHKPYTTSSNSRFNVNYDVRDLVVSSPNIHLFAPFDEVERVSSKVYDIYCYPSLDGAGSNYIGVNQNKKTEFGLYNFIGGTTYNENWNKNNNYRYFHITAGNDVSNTTLINYLYTYATQCDSNWNPL